MPPSQRTFYCLLDRPTVRDALSQGTYREAHSLSPLDQTQGLACIGQRLGSGYVPPGAPVLSLLRSSSPSAIPRRVRSVIVDPVEGMVERRARPHVRVEPLERDPLRADGDASPAVPGIGRVTTVQATRTHAQPHRVFGRSVPSVGRPDRQQRLAAPAATRNGQAASERSSGDRTGFAANTATHPSDPTFWCPLCVLGDHGQAAEMSAGRHGNLWRHQAHSWCQTPAVDAVRGHFASLNYTRRQVRLLLKEKEGSPRDRLAGAHP